ncbi:hypothetical protein PM082_020233 [Marasmius tenuissimus]|nr:hypothetical protein PM082_020233 [Marasmius tenuissimus]
MIMSKMAIPAVGEYIRVPDPSTLRPSPFAPGRLTRREGLINLIEGAALCEVLLHKKIVKHVWDTLKASDHYYM